jgi:uncharacterized protein with HEPN domain
MSDRPLPALVADILEAIAKIERYTVGHSEESFSADEKSVDAVVRNVEIIGEAANRLPSQFKTDTPQIPWKKIVGMRHRVVHDYFGIDLQIIWRIVQVEIPELKKNLVGESERPHPR